MVEPRTLPMPVLATVLVAGLTSIVTLRSFGLLQTQLVPPWIVHSFYIPACLSLAALTIINGSVALKSALAVVTFGCSLTTVLMVQSFRLDDGLLQVTIKTIACSGM